MIQPEKLDRVAVFFDMSNLYFTARDLGVRIDYTKLLEFLVAGRRLYCAYAYVALSGDDSTAVPFLTWLRRNGFRVVTKSLKRLPDGSLKGDLDLELAVDLLTQAPHFDVAVLVSGDGDFTYLVESAQRLGLRVEVASTPRNTSVELMEAADRYIDLEANLRHFSQPRPAGYSEWSRNTGTGRLDPEAWRYRPATQRFDLPAEEEEEEEEPHEPDR